MVDRSALLAALTATAAELPATGSLVARLCEAARRVAGADGASLSLTPAGVDHTTRVVLWATDDVATRLEQVLDVVGLGPATDAVRDDRAVVADLTDRGGPWPAYAEMAARQTSAASLTVVPLHAGAGVLGLLSLYRSAPGPLAAGLDDLGFLADVIAVAVLDDALPAGPPLPGPWDERSVIHQAAGMVMAQLAVPAPDALALLRAHAFALDLTLPEVAQQVLDRTLQFRPDEGS